MKTSQTLSKLAVSLVKAQAAIGAAKKSSANPFFKSNYSSLAEVIETVKEPLNKNGLSFLQVVNKDVVETVILHESGEFISGKTSIVVSKASDPQAMGSAITYAKRYGLQALLGVPSEDDDGNAASGKGGAPSNVVVKAAIKTDKTNAPTSGLDDLDIF